MQPSCPVSSLIETTKNFSLQNTPSFGDQFVGTHKTDQTLRGSHRILADTLQCFTTGKLEAFDALASDCACQVRALFVATFSLDQNLQKEAATLKQTIKPCLEKLNLNGRQVKSCSCSASEPILRLAQCFMLAQVRAVVKTKKLCTHCQQSEEGFQEQTDCNKLAKYFRFKSTPSDEVIKIVEEAKQAVALFGAHFLSQQTQNSLYAKMLSTDNQLAINGRQELPCFYSLQTVFESAMAKQIPILLKVKKTAHTHEKSPDEPFETAILLENGASLSSISCVIVVEGMRMSDETPEAHKKRLLTYSFFDLLAMDGAQHPQYTGNRGIETIPAFQNEQLGEEKKRLYSLAAKAKEVGCHKENMQLLCITHIFCDTLTQQKEKGVLL